MSLKLSGDPRNTDGAAAGAARPRGHPHRTDLLEKQATGLVALGKAAENAWATWALLGAASRLQGTLAVDPEQVEVWALMQELTGNTKNIPVKLKVKAAPTAL